MQVEWGTNSIILEWDFEHLNDVIFLFSMREKLTMLQPKDSGLFLAKEMPKKQVKGIDKSQNYWMEEIPAPLDRWFIRLSHYLKGFNHPRWCWISSIHSMENKTRVKKIPSLESSSKPAHLFGSSGWISWVSFQMWLTNTVTNLLILVYEATEPTIRYEYVWITLPQQNRNSQGYYH